MTMIQNPGMTGMNGMLGKANDAAGASSSNPAGYLAMMKILTALGFVGFALAFLLRQRDTAHMAMDWRPHRWFARPGVSCLSALQLVLGVSWLSDAAHYIHDLKYRVLFQPDFPFVELTSHQCVHFPAPVRRAVATIPKYNLITTESVVLF